jgi:chemotaxis signal transduction protein
VVSTVSTGADKWLRFRVANVDYGLPVGTVVQVVRLTGGRQAGVAGWRCLVPLGGGMLPVADGAAVLECGDAGDPQFALVLRGRWPLGIAVDEVVGLSSGLACPVMDGDGPSGLVTGGLPTSNGSIRVLHAERLWSRLALGLTQLPGEGGYSLRPLTSLPERRAQTLVRLEPARAEAPVSQPLRVMVFRSGVDLDLALPSDRVLELGPGRTGRLLKGAPKFIAGVLSWRGRLVPLIDLSARLGCPVRQPGQTLYLDVGGRPVAVKVERVIGQALVPSYRSGPFSSAVPPGWVRGVARLGDRALIILEPEALMTAVA